MRVEDAGASGTTVAMWATDKPVDGDVLAAVHGGPPPHARSANALLPPSGQHTLQEACDGGRPIDEDRALAATIVGAHAQRHAVGIDAEDALDGDGRAVRTGCWPTRCSTSTKQVYGSIPCSRQVTIRLCTMPPPVPI